MSSSGSFAPPIGRLSRESDLMLMRSAVGLKYRTVVAGRTSTVLYLHRVFYFFVDRCCRLEDMSDQYSS